MEWSMIESRWPQYRAKVKLQWDKLSEQQIAGTQGKREYLVSRVKEAYSLSRDEAESQIAQWQSRQTGSAVPTA